MVPWLGLHAPTAGGMGSTPGQGRGTKIPHATRHLPKKKKKVKKKKRTQAVNLMTDVFFFFFFFYPQRYTGHE